MQNSTTAVIRFITLPSLACYNLSTWWWPSLLSSSVLTATTVAWFTVLAPTLVIIPSKPSSCALYRDGVLSMSLFSYIALLTAADLLTHYLSVRCTANDSDLKETTGPTFCHREHSEVLVQDFSIAQLWDEWGLVGDIFVCIIFTSHPY